MACLGRHRGSLAQRVALRRSKIESHFGRVFTFAVVKAEPLGPLSHDFGRQAAHKRLIYTRDPLKHPPLNHLDPPTALSFFSRVERDPPSSPRSTAAAERPPPRSQLEAHTLAKSKEFPGFHSQSAKFFSPAARCPTRIRPLDPISIDPHSIRTLHDLAPQARRKLWCFDKILAGPPYLSALFC